MKPDADRTGDTSERWDASWAGVEWAQLKTMLAATPAQRLAWLEAALRLAHASGALKGARPATAATLGARSDRVASAAENRRTIAVEGPRHA